jgi:hypothetical protein
MGLLTVNLYWFLFFERFQLSTSPLGQIADWRLLANAIRFPYLLALVWPLWRVVLRPSRFVTAGSPSPSTTNSTVNADVFIVKRFFALMAGAGLTNVEICASRRPNRQ